MNILEINGLEKRFGDKKVLCGVDMVVPSGKVFGFVGRNGAGKTTTMKAVLGLIAPDRGDIKVNGEKVVYGNTKTNKYIGYLPDVPEYYSFMTPTEYLAFCGEITDMDKKETATRSKELLELVGLGTEKHRIKGFSRGMKQRLGIAQALLGKPKLLICDEPTSALDPLGRKEILEILVKAKEKTTVLFSTHILSDVEHICDEMALLNAGKIVIKGTIDEVKKKRRGNAVEIVMENRESTESLLNNPDFIKKLDKKDKNSLLLKDEKELPGVLRYIADNKLQFIRIEKQEATLEDIFMEAIGSREEKE